MLRDKHTLPSVVQKTSSVATSKSSLLGASVKHRRGSSQISAASSRSTSPQLSRQAAHHHLKQVILSVLQIPPKKQFMNLSDSDSIHDRNSGHQQGSIFSFLLFNFDSKFSTPRLLFQQLIEYVPRENISQIVPTHVRPALEMEVREEKQRGMVRFVVAEGAGTREIRRRMAAVCYK